MVLLLSPAILVASQPCVQGSFPSAMVGVSYDETLSLSTGYFPCCYQGADSDVSCSGILPPGLTCVGSTGTRYGGWVRLYGVPVVDGTFCFEVQARYSVSGTLCWQEVECVTVLPACGTTIGPPTLPPATEGMTYSESLSATGGPAPYTFSIYSGSLPPGLALSSGGRISGWAGQPGTSTFVVQAEDATGCPTWKSYTIDVTCATTVTLAPGGLTDAILGSPYTTSFTATGDVAPYQWTSIGSLPPGIAFLAGGTIDGTPTALGSYTFTVAATSARGCEGSRPYTLDVTEAPSYILGHGAGIPNDNRFRIFDRDGVPTTVDVLAYGAGRWGADVASGNLDGGSRGEVLSAPGPGESLGPHVRGFRRDGTAMPKVSFYAYTTLKYGANVASGDVDGDRADEILTAPGPGAVFGPHVRAFVYDGLQVTALAKVSFFAYATLRYGANVAGADPDGDGFDEIAAGPGPGASFGAVVRGFDYDGVALAAISKINFAAFSSFGYGVDVAVDDVELDGFAEIVAGAGAGPSNPPELRGFDYDADRVLPLPGFAVTLPGGTFFGARAALLDQDRDTARDLAGAPGPDPGAAAVVSTYAYDGAGLAPVLTFDAFPGDRFGVNVAGGSLGY